MLQGNQIILVSIVGLMVLLFLWGRWRHDLVALGCLLACVVVGLVPATAAFSGFGHPAVITVACVLVLSQGLRNTGTVDVLARRLLGHSDSPTVTLATLMTIGAVLSAFMNNVGAMALLMPIAIKFASRHDIAPGKMLMPLSFATILGGMTTLIGTPPNLIVSGFRADLGDSFSMFDFAPVGVALAVSCILFLALAGWRLVPTRSRSDTPGFDTGTYLTELHVQAGSSAVDRAIASIQRQLDDADAQIVGMVRNKFRVLAPTPNRKVREQDVLIVEAEPESLSSIVTLLDLTLAPKPEGNEPEAGEKSSADAKDNSGEAIIAEFAVTPNSSLIGRSAAGLLFGQSHGLNLLAISRQGRQSIKRIRSTPILAGDVMLLQGSPDAIGAFSATFGAIPLAEREVTIPDQRRASLATITLLAAIGAAAFGLFPAAIAFAAGVLVYGVSHIVRPQNLYAAIDWPVIVLLAALLPVADAMSTTGTADQIANGLLNLFAGDNAVIALTLVLVITMTLSDFMNNAATAAVMCPIAIGIANQLGASPDSFLMAVAIGASCAMLTPIGHQNNTLILGPGGFRFGDYWRVGLPLEILVILIGVPLLMLVWPLGV
ncbi:MAG: SLC13 family permease [Pseudomonadota bacterium]